MRRVNFFAALAVKLLLLVPGRTFSPVRRVGGTLTTSLAGRKGVHPHLFSSASPLSPSTEHGSTTSARENLVARPWPICTTVSDRRIEEILHFTPAGGVRSSLGGVGIWWPVEHAEELVEFTLLHDGSEEADEGLSHHQPWRYSATLQSPVVMVGTVSAISPTAPSDGQGSGGPPSHLGKFASSSVVAAGESRGGGDGPSPRTTAPAAPSALGSSLPQRQQWALLDNVPKYTVNAGTCLWRRMTDEVPELCGFSPHALRAEWLLMAGSSADDSASLASPLLLDEWLWHDDSGGGEGGGGCVSGRIYGSSFVADGTRITTRPVLAPAVSAKTAANLGRDWADSTSAAAFERATKDGFVVVSVPHTAAMDDGSSVLTAAAGADVDASPSLHGREVILELGVPRHSSDDELASAAGGLLDKFVGGSGGDGVSGGLPANPVGLLDGKKVSKAVQDALPTLLAAGTTAAALGVLQSHVTLQMFWVT